MRKGNFWLKTKIDFDLWGKLGDVGFCAFSIIHAHSYIKDNYVVELMISDISKVFGWHFSKTMKALDGLVEAGCLKYEKPKHGSRAPTRFTLEESFVQAIRAMPEGSKGKSTLKKHEALESDASKLESDASKLESDASKLESDASKLESDARFKNVKRGEQEAKQPCDFCNSIQCSCAYTGEPRELRELRGEEIAAREKRLDAEARVGVETKTTEGKIEGYVPTESGEIQHPSVEDWKLPEGFEEIRNPKMPKVTPELVEAIKREWAERGMPVDTEFAEAEADSRIGHEFQKRGLGRAYVAVKKVGLNLGGKPFDMEEFRKNGFEGFMKKMRTGGKL